MSTRSHLGRCFEVWNRGQSWFWSVVDPNRNGGTIGAAATEEDAIFAARSSIEDASMKFSCTQSECWHLSMANLERYLMEVCNAAA